MKQQQHVNKVWLNYYQIEETSRTDLLHKEISFKADSPVNIMTHPFSCIGLLKYTNSSRGVSLNGTAFLIDSDLIVTIAENIYSKQDECFFKDFYFYPTTLNPTETPIRVREYRIDEAYIKTESHDALASVSFALMKLDRPVYRPHYLQVKYNYSYEEGRVSMYGYPKPINGQRMLGREGKIIKIQDSIIIHSILSEPGQGGSPIMVEIDGKYKVIGVHFSISNHYGVGLHFTKELIMKLCRWERQMMVSRINISQYNEEGPETNNEVFTYSFSTHSMEINPHMANWSALWVQWEAAEEHLKKFIINGNKITRKQLSYFDNRHMQVTTAQPLPKQGKYTIKAKIISYGNEGPFDTIYFGLITQKHKKKDYSDGRHRGGIAYLSFPDNLAADGSGKGTILMDGVQVAHGQDLFLKEGDEVKMEVNLFTSQLTFTNKRRSVTCRAGQHYGNKNLYLFSSLSTDNSCMSWHSADGPVWN